MSIQVSEQRVITLSGLQVVYHDGWEKIAINQRVLPLTPTEYQLLRVFLAQRLSPLLVASFSARKAGREQAEVVLVAYVKREDLQEQVSIQSRALLRKHLSNLNSKLMSYGLRISTLDRTRGYVLLLDTGTSADPKHQQQKQNWSQSP